MKGHRMGECKQIGRVGAYCDGELPADERAEFETHLTACHECRAEAAHVRSMSRMFSAWDTPELSEPALDRVHAAVDQVPAAGIRRMAGVFAMAAALILVVCLAGLVRQRTAESALPAAWEAAAVAPQRLDAASGEEESLARWMLEDLSRKDGRD